MATMSNSNEALRDHTRVALEQVCARGDFEAATKLYSADFIDHVNELDFRGHEGVRQSVSMYLSVLTDLRIEVHDQVAEGDRVVSRWIATGANRKRQVQLSGITISRFADGQIAEDWTVSDNLSLVRQLGLWRAALVGLRQLIGRVR
jgi:predicted ester cyclase